MARSLNSVNFEITADASQALREIRKVRRAANTLYVPAWCRNPIARGFVMGNALAAPIMLLLWAVAR